MSSFVVKNNKPTYRDQRAACGRKTSYFQAEKRREIDQRHCTSIEMLKKKRKKRKETTYLLTTRHLPDQTIKLTAVDDREL